MTLTVDLPNQGHVDYCMTFFIFGCLYDKNQIYASISLCLMPRILQLLNFVTWPQRMTSKIKVRDTYCDPLFIMGCIRDEDTMLVSIWTYPMFVISIWLIYVTWPPLLTLEIKVKHTFKWPSLSLFTTFLISSISKMLESTLRSTSYHVCNRRYEMKSHAKKCST